MPTKTQIRQIVPATLTSLRNHLSGQDLLKFKRMFEQQRTDLSTQPALPGADEAMAPAPVADELDQSRLELERALQWRLQARESKYLQKVQAALERIANGTFGLCADCEEPIELRRLEARPTTTSCLRCKELDEKREKLFA